MKKPLSNQKTTSIIIVGILCLGLFFRLPLLNNSFWLDEAAQALESIRPLSQQLEIAHDFQPPLFHLLVHFFSGVSHAESWLRSTSVIAGLVMIWATYQMTRYIWNQQVAIISSLLLITNSFHIFYSQELRPYAFAGMFASLSWYILILYTRQLKAQKKTLLASFVALSIAGVYTTYLFPFCLVGQLLYLLIASRTKALSSVILIGGVTTMAFLPWLPEFRQQLAVSSELRVRTPNWEHVVSTPQFKALPLVFGKFLFGNVDLEISPIFILPLLLVVATSIAIIGTDKSKYFSLHPVLMLCWLIFPVLAAWSVSFFIPVLQAKRVLFSLPALEILFAVLIYQGIHAKKNTAGLVLALLVFSIHITSTLLYYTNPMYQRENWKSVITQIDKAYSPSDTIVVFRFDYVFAPWDWYDHKTFRFIVTGTGTKTALSEIDQAMKPALDYDQVIVFDYLRDLTDPNHFVEQWLESYNYHQTQLIDGKVMGFVRVYTKGGVFADADNRHD